MCDIWYKIFDIHFALTVFGISYYAYILHTIISSSSTVFQSAYFRIFIVTGIFDIVGLIVLEYTHGELTVGFGPTLEPWTRIAMASTGINFFTHIFGCFLMTVNRYTAVRYPHHYENIWTSTVVYVLVIADIAIAYAAFFPLYSVRFLYESCDFGWELSGRSESVHGTRIMASSVTVLYELISVMLILHTIWIIRQKYNTSGRRIGKDMGLIFVTAINCILNMFGCIYDVSFLLNIDEHSSSFLMWIIDQYDINMFLIMVTNAFSIVFLSKTVRNEILYKWFHTKSTRTATITTI